MALGIHGKNGQNVVTLVVMVLERGLEHATLAIMVEPTVQGLQWRVNIAF